MTHSRKPQATPLGANAAWPVAGGREPGRRGAQLGACCRAIGPLEGIKPPLKPAA